MAMGHLSSSSAAIGADNAGRKQVRIKGTLSSTGQRRGGYVGEYSCS